MRREIISYEVYDILSQFLCFASTLAVILIRRGGEESGAGECEDLSYTLSYDNIITHRGTFRLLPVIYLILLQIFLRPTFYRAP